MAECKVCGEKIEEGQEYCSVCAPEHHEKIDVSIGESAEASQNDIQAEDQDNKIEIKKEQVIPEDIVSGEVKPEDSAEEDDSE
jgi:hypothetical protein